ncbi:hypothetical protein BK639_03265 [Pseudomonas protegens]|nr:hypothetical protein BK639_03265 [Pseudomonas protegens]
MMARQQLICTQLIWLKEKIPTGTPHTNKMMTPTQMAGRKERVAWVRVLTNPPSPAMRAQLSTVSH